MFIREMNNLCVMKVDYINTYYIIEVMNYDIYIYIYAYNIPLSNNISDN